MTPDERRRKLREWCDFRKSLNGIEERVERFRTRCVACGSWGYHGEHFCPDCLKLLRDSLEEAKGTDGNP